MFEVLILGIIQGVSEWLPVSSEGLIVLANIYLFNTSVTIEEITKIALFLHLGTFFSALIYFRKDVLELIDSLMNYNKTDSDTKKTLNFLILSSFITGIIGIFIFKSFVNYSFEIGVQALSVTIGVLLLITAWLQIKVKSYSIRGLKNLNAYDAVALGVLQSFAVLPGLSRSGLTIAGLLLRKIDKTLAIKLSFLMSLPVVLGGNIILNIKDFEFTYNLLFGLIASFLFGLATIHAFIKFSERINFGYFVLIFGLLMIVLGLI